MEMKWLLDVSNLIIDALRAHDTAKEECFRLAAYCDSLVESPSAITVSQMKFIREKLAHIRGMDPTSLVGESPTPPPVEGEVTW